MPRILMASEPHVEHTDNELRSFTLNGVTIHLPRGRPVEVSYEDLKLLHGVGVGYTLLLDPPVPPEEQPAQASAAAETAEDTAAGWHVAQRSPDAQEN